MRFQSNMIVVRSFTTKLGLKRREYFEKEQSRTFSA